MIISLPGRIGMNDRGARRSLSLVRHRDPHWKPKLIDFATKLKEAVGFVVSRRIDIARRRPARTMHILSSSTSWYA